MGNLVNSLMQSEHLMGCSDTIVLGPHCTAQVVNYRASADTVIDDPVGSGCYISVMGANDAYSPHYPDYPASSFEHRFMATVISEPLAKDTIILPKGGKMQAIRMQFPLNHGIASSLATSQSDDFLLPFEGYSAGWQTPLFNELAAVVRTVWECEYTGEARKIWLHAKMLEILALIMTRPKPQSLVDRACSEVQHRPDNRWTIKSLAKALNTNECYLKSAFREELGVGVAYWIQHHRVSLAKDKLQHGTQSVTDIALSLGYQSSSHFTQVFKRHVGTTPNNFRNRT